MTADRDEPRMEPTLLHQFKNQLGIVIGFCDLLLLEVAESDPKHADLLEIRRAANAAVALLPELSRRLGSDGHG